MPAKYVFPVGGAFAVRVAISLLAVDLDDLGVAPGALLVVIVLTEPIAPAFEGRAGIEFRKPGTIVPAGSGVPESIAK